MDTLKSIHHPLAFISPTLTHAVHSLKQRRPDRRADVILHSRSTFLLLALFCAFWIKQAGGCDGPGHGVRVAVRCRPAVLEVAFPLLAHLARDADAGAPVGHSGREVFDGGGLVETREAPLVVLPSAWVVHSDVLAVFFAQLLDGLLDVSVVGGEKVECWWSLIDRMSCNKKWLKM